MLENKKLNILLIEDDEVDVINIKKVMSDLNMANDVQHFWDGEEAVEFMKSDKFQRPSIILLDINMPRMNGHEFLEWLRNSDDSNHKDLPVVVLTTSDSAMDIEDAYKNMVSGYIVKPIDIADFVTSMKILGKYWLLCENPT